jgi:hypothetical protein
MARHPLDRMIPKRMEQERTMEYAKYLSDSHFEIDPKFVSTYDLTPAKLREVALHHRVTSGPGVDIRYMPSEREVESVGNMLYHAVTHGQVIDFGYWPNAFIKQSSKHGGTLYNSGALAHPFSTPYCLLHQWDDVNHPMHEMIKRNRPMTSAYLVNPFPNSGTGLCCDFEVVDLDAVKVGSLELLGIGDRATYYANESISGERAQCAVIPFALRFPETIQNEVFKQAMGEDVTILEASLANVLDPVVTALAILGTRGITSETIKPSEKLLAARKKTGKPPIPSYRKVDSSTYVTAIMSRKEHHSHGPGDGTRASPKAHVRIGHWRHYKDGEMSFIKDTLVAATDDMRQLFKSSRSHYVVKDTE